ncbi:restriction endonuclease subunit S [Neobacillus sp. OS1-2]|uniref:restriction endonuclease subunit S n=1 Tax=Neobacillus sp. OS1-2 TaxID=3070680 RepID=UPI0027E0A582|nr:restriction endonuclease subunit S [Neobacillus sp. OS1-2]WML40749.1 restriction endonuclease subunit S [Neobacillus sp. OS1-2]
MSKKKNIDELMYDIVATGEEYKKVHENWVWVRLGSVCNFKRGPFGSAIKKSMFVPKNKDTYKVYEQGNAIRKTIDYGDYYISREDFENLKGFEINTGDIIVSCAGTIGETFIIPSPHEKGVINQALMRVITSRVLDNAYFLYAFDYYIKQLAKDNAKGTAIKNLPPLAELKQYVIPLPPLNEQKRIAAKVERLFNKIEEAKQLIEETKKTFEFRRAAILDKAFRGKLTAKWREQQGVGMESWEETELQKHTSLLGDGLHGTPKYSDNGEFYFINGNNFDGISIVLKPETKRVNIEEYEKYKKNLTDKTVFVSINGTLGKTAFYNEEPIILGKSACYFNVKESLDKRFIRYYLETQQFLDYAHTMATGSTIKNLSLKAMRNLPLHLPSLPEQQEIVRILDSLFEKEQKGKEVCDVIDKIDQIKKAIFSKAFRGELGTNDPNEENVIELLKEVLQEQVK